MFTHDGMIIVPEENPSPSTNSLAIESNQGSLSPVKSIGNAVEYEYVKGFEGMITSDELHAGMLAITWRIGVKDCMIVHPMTSDALLKNITGGSFIDAAKRMKKMRCIMWPVSQNLHYYLLVAIRNTVDLPFRFVILDPLALEHDDLVEALGHYSSSEGVRDNTLSGDVSLMFLGPHHPQKNHTYTCAVWLWRFVNRILRFIRKNIGNNPDVYPFDTTMEDAPFHCAPDTEESIQENNRYAIFMKHKMAKWIQRAIDKGHMELSDLHRSKPQSTETWTKDDVTCIGEKLDNPHFLRSKGI
jgi:hypothetical protein